MRCRFPEIDRLMKLPETRPVTEYELDAIVEASGRTRGVFVDDPTAGKSRRRNFSRVEPPEDLSLRHTYDDQDW